MNNNSPLSSLNSPLLLTAAQFFFPQRRCIICGEISGVPGLCEACREEFFAMPRCDICSAFIEAPGLCPQCAATRPYFTLSRAAAPYAGALRDSLRDFKYQEKTWLRRPLAALLAQTYTQYYQELPISAVTPVPLSASRLKARGYNQSAMLSRLLAAEFYLDHQPGLLTRQLDTPPLATYDGAQRRVFLTQAFSASPAAQGQTVLLVDDIYTSGATLNACAAALLAAGAQAVYGLTAASYDARGKIEDFDPSRANIIRCYIRTRKEKSE